MKRPRETIRRSLISAPQLPRVPSLLRLGLVAYDVNFPDTLLLGINLRDRRLHDVYRLNLKNGALELDTENPGDVTGWAADNDLQIRAATSFTEDGGTRIRVRDSVQTPWRDFQRWGNDETFGGAFGFSPDNKRLRAISSVDANAARLVEIDIVTRKSTVIAEDPDYDVGGILINEKTKAIEAVQFNRARREWKVLDKSLAADFEIIKKQRDADFGIASRDLADKTWLVTYTDDDAPVYYYNYDRGKREATVLFSNRPGLEKYKLAQMKPVSFKARDGMTIHGYLTVPVGVGRKASMVVNVHGGPWARDS
jgi:dipeptidyl aminopeptidase/acylaminoacyl peptidase